MKRKSVFIKPVMTYSPVENKVRLLRILWRPVPCDGYYSRSLSISLWPKCFRFWREFNAWFLTLCCLQLHFKWAEEGVFPD